MTNHQDYCGNELQPGQIVLLLNANYKSGGSFDVGVVVGATPKMVKVFETNWRGGCVTNRNIEKLIAVNNDQFQPDSHLFTRLMALLEHLRKTDFDMGLIK